MKKIVLFFIIFSAIYPAINGQSPVGQSQLTRQKDELISVGASGIDLIYRVNGNDGRLYQAYLGTKLNSTDMLASQRDGGHMAYATFGTDNLFEPAIRMTHNDGNPSLELKYDSHTVEKPEPDITLTRIVLKDPEYPVTVTLNIKAYMKEDVIEQWVEIVQRESKPLIIYNYASSMLHFDAVKYWLTQFHGDWAEEMKMEESQLTSGIKILDTKLGTRAHMYQTPVFLLSLNNRSDENTGELIAGTLGWSGNFQFTFEVDEKNSLRVI